MKYRIFNETLDSNIRLPELQEEENSPPSIFFQSIPAPSLPCSAITWLHHWRLPNGQISISSGKEKTNYWLRFPQIADFQIIPAKSKILCYHLPEIPDNSIRHLLLDQVIPRMLSHQGQQIIHASCVRVGKSAIAFSGESGWGKSTIAAFFHTHGYTLLTDDCLLLQTYGSKVLGTPNYQGARLFQDSLSLLSEEKHAIPVAHYGTKKRLLMTDIIDPEPIPIRAVFILSDPVLRQLTTSVSIKKVSGAAAAMELVKNCFPLDIKDKKRMGTQMQQLAQIGGSKNISIYHLDYPRRTNLLPELMKKILTLCHTESTGD